MDLCRLAMLRKAGQKKKVTATVTGRNSVAESIRAKEPASGRVGGSVVGGATPEGIVRCEQFQKVEISIVGTETEEHPVVCVGLRQKLRFAEFAARQQKPLEAAMHLKPFLEAGKIIGRGFQMQFPFEISRHPDTFRGSV